MKKIIERLQEGIGGDVEMVKSEAMFLGAKKQMAAGEKEGKRLREKYSGEDLDDAKESMLDLAAEEADAAKKSLDVLRYYAGTAILGFDKRTMRATADLVSELNALYYHIGVLAAISGSKL